MADTEDLYPSAARLGRLDKVRPPKPPKLDCIVFHLEDGTDFYYAYRHICAVKLTRASELVIHCTCGEFESITLKGSNLRLVAPLVAHATLAEIEEASRPIFVGQTPVVVKEVVIKAVDKHPARSANGNL